MRRILTLVLLTAVCSFPLTGCSKKASPTSTSSSGPSFTYPFLFSLGVNDFCDIQGVAISGNNIFVADDCADAIGVFDLNGNVVTYFYPYNTSYGADIEPEGMAADGHGNLFIADSNNHVIDIYNVLNFSVTTVAPGDFLYTDNYYEGDCVPQAVALDDQDNLYVADAGCYEIYKITQAGVTTGHTYVSSTYTYNSGGNPSVNSGNLGDPNGIAVSPDGNHVYVADTTNNVIQEFNNSMIPIGVIGDVSGAPSTANGKFDTPTDVHLDNEGNLLVADFGNSRVQKLSPSGAYLTSIGTEPTFATGELLSPLYLAVDSNDDVYVADNNLGQVNKYAPH